MPFYAVVNHVSGDTIVTMEADSPTSVPTRVFGEEWACAYAEDLVKNVGTVGGMATVQGIGSRLGSYNRLIEVEDGSEELAKSDTTSYTIRADQSGESVGKVYVSDNVLVGYDGDIPPMGYQDGKAIGDFMDENRGYVLTPVADSASLEEDADDVVDNEEQARLVGTAVGSALLASGVISKADEEQQVVYGWAYVTHDREGNVVVDKSGDFVDDIGEIEKTAIDFMLHSRQGDTDHSNKASTTIVESMVFTPEKMAAMGIEKGTMPSGWWIGAKCDDETWAGYMAGRWKAFSVHGSGTRKSVD